LWSLAPQAKLPASYSKLIAQQRASDAQLSH